MPARLELIRTRLLTLAARVVVRGGESVVRAKEFSGRRGKTLTFPEAHVLERYPYAAKKSRPASRRDRRARRARSTRIRAAKVTMDAARRAPRAIGARRRACSVAVRKTAIVAHEYPYAKKVTETPRRAASPAPRRRADANLGAPRPGHARVPSSHASPGARGGRCPRAPARGVWRSARGIWRIRRSDWSRARSKR